MSSQGFSNGATEPEVPSPDVLVADFQTHHIEGFARAAIEAGKPGQFSAPLISQIDGNLYMGGCRNGVSLGDEFDYVISLYPWESYRIGENTKRWEIEMYDAGEIPDPTQLLKIARHVCKCVNHGKTLVHCQAGLNRSGLVSALALILSGHSAASAIEMLRQMRSPVVLCNTAFESWLLEWDEELAA